MRYPLELNQIDTDYVVFTHHEYRSNASGESPGPEGAPITLYMPNTTPTIGQQQDWGEQDFAGPMGALRRDVGMAMADSAMTADFSSQAKAEASAKRGVENFKSAFNSAKDNGGGALRQVAVGFAAGVAGTSPNQLLALSKGEIYNPNVELLYKGPKIRSFTFNYSFVPKSASEARAVNSIIKEFRTWSSPHDNNGMFEIPHVWQVTYMSGVGPNANINYFKRAALRNVSVQANSGLTMHSSHADGQPISYNLALSFTEVDLVLRKDHQSGGAIGF